VKNATTQPLTVTASLNYMPGGSPVTLALPVQQLKPQETRQLDLPSMLASLGLGALNGDINLSFSITGHGGDLVIATGSVDQTGNYVFPAPAAAIGKSFGKGIGYWTVANGQDTMYSLWNPTNTDQDFVLTLHYGDGSGQYVMPLHLAAQASTTIDVGMLIAMGQPDANGNLIPSYIQEGSAVVSNPKGPAQWMTVAVCAAFYNPRKATCGGPYCIDCYGFDDEEVLLDPVAVAVTGTVQLQAQATYSDGTVVSFTTSSTWSSSNTAVATVGASTGLVSGVSPGSAQIGAQFPSLVDTTEDLCSTSSGLYCPTYEPSAESSVSVPATATISGGAYVPLVQGGSSGPNTTTFTASATPSSCSVASYSWTTSSSKVSLSNTSAATVTVTSVSASAALGDVPITASLTFSNCPAASATASITVMQPTSLQVVTDTISSTGHTCVGGTGTNTCSQSYFSGSGSYNSYVRNRTYHIMDQLSPPDWIAGYNLQIQESYSAPTGQCSQNATPVTGAGFGDTVTDCFYFCSGTCQSGGSCNLSSTQTVTVNGFPVATESVNWTCTGVSVSP
jgi:hypothetical protein